MFLEIEFPRGIGFRSVGGPGFSTNINTGFGGQEQRNQNWANARGKWSNVAVKTQPGSQYFGTRRNFIDAVNAFFLNAAGRANGFRFFDARDHSLAGQVIAIGDGSTKSFQLIKKYTIGAHTYTRNITKPVWSTAVDWQGAALANSLSFAGGLGAFTLDATTGIVTFTAAPGVGVSITIATGDFDYPVRFDTDDLPIEAEESYAHGDELVINANSLKLVEVFPPNY